MLERDAIAALIPHQGGMCLLEHVVEWNAQSIRLTTSSHVSATNPLRSAGRLRAVHLCEYGAQAMAVHGGLVAQATGGRADPGLLVSLRDVKLYCDYVDDRAGELTIEAHRLLEGGGSWQYRFTVKHADTVLAEGRAAVMAARSTR